MLSYKILVVDDVMIMRKVIKDILVDHCNMDPLYVLEAADGENAVFMYKEFRPDIVFLDIAIPDSDGKTLVKEFLEINPQAKIIMCTGSSDKMSVVECIRSGARDYIRKPPTPDRVQKALEKVVDMEGEAV